MRVFSFEERVAAIHMLRVNLKSLVFESRAIRFEERRAGVCYRSMLRDHRIRKLREEIRYTGLALAFVRGRSLSQVEKRGSKAIDVARLHEKIRRKTLISRDDVEAWVL